MYRHFEIGRHGFICVHLCLWSWATPHIELHFSGGEYSSKIGGTLYIKIFCLSVGIGCLMPRNSKAERLPFAIRLRALAD